MLVTLLDILTRVNVDELTDRFVELYEAAVSMLNPDDQETAKAALADIRADNDEAHARLQSKLEAAKAAQ